MAVAMVRESEDKTMLVTMKSSDLIDKLVVIADGSLDLVREAINASAKDADGAELLDVIKYIQAHRPTVEPQAA
jgi:hypothetical protein